MANLRKPSISFKWKGSVGNKYREYTVKTIAGTTYETTYRDKAHDVYNKNLKHYKRLKKLGY